jgi:hypothetical protein
MGVAKGYFDDSQTTGRVWAIGGYVGNEFCWEDFDVMWPMALANHEMPYFHMKEMADPNGIYKKWHPPQEHQAELADFFSGLATVIRQTSLNGFCCLVRIADLDRFNAEKNLSLQPYPLAAYGCMLLVGREYLGHQVEMTFDHVEKVDSKLAMAKAYADSDKYFGPDGVFDSVKPRGLPRGLSSKNIPGLQAADFWTWEHRKNHLRMDEWWTLVDRPQNYGDEQWEHMSQWVTRKYGGFEAGTRKSMQALITPAKFKCMIWNYQELCDAHATRDGVWRVS